MSFDEVLLVSAKSFSWYCLLFYYKQAGYLYVFYCQACHNILVHSLAVYWLMKAPCSLALKAE